MFAGKEAIRIRWQQTPNVTPRWRSSRRAVAEGYAHELCGCASGSAFQLARRSRKPLQTIMIRSVTSGASRVQEGQPTLLGGSGERRPGVSRIKLASFMMMIFGGDRRRRGGFEFGGVPHW